MIHNNSKWHEILKKNLIPIQFYTQFNISNLLFSLFLFFIVFSYTPLYISNKKKNWYLKNRIRTEFLAISTSSHS